MTFPSSSSWAPSVQTSYSFEPAFFDSKHAEESRLDGARADGLDAGPAPAYAPPPPPNSEISEFKPMLKRQNREFLESPDGHRAREEWQTAITAVLEFTGKHRLTAATTELSHLLAFRKKHAGPKPQGEIELYRPECKQALEAVVRHLGNEDISLQHRCQTLLRIEGLKECPQRHASELKRAALRLAGLAGGLGASVWSAFSDVALVHLRELLRGEARLAHHDLSTPHALDPFAAALRLPGFSLASELTDTFIIDVRAHADEIRRCADGLAQRMDMTTIAEHLADDCLMEVGQKLEDELKGATLAVWEDLDHWPLLEKALQAFVPRFGDLHVHQVAALDDEGDLTGGLTDDPRLLAIGIRHNMAEQHIAPPPQEQVLQERRVHGKRERIVLFEGRWPYIALDDGTGEELNPPRRFLNRQEIDALLRPTGLPRGLDARTRQALRAFADSSSAARSDPEATRERVAACPTAAGLETVIERQGLDDLTLASWLSQAAPNWEADAFDHALHLLLRGHGGAPLAALLASWDAEGFTDSWQRQLHEQAVRDRSLNTEARVRGGDGVEDGDAEVVDRPSPQRQLIGRFAKQLGRTVPVFPARVGLVRFKSAYPLGSDRSRVGGPAWDGLISALQSLRSGPGRRLTAPMLNESAGLSDALETTFYQGGPERLLVELALIRRLSIQLDLSAEETAALLQVSGTAQYPVPSPLMSAALIAGKPFLVDSLFKWVTAMVREERLDSAAARRILLADAREAEQVVSTVKEPHVHAALTRYLSGLDTACAAGVLRPVDLLSAAGYPKGTPCTLLRAAAARGGGEADLQAWRASLPGLLAAQTGSSLPSTRSNVSSA